ncbi:MAG: rod shape-determining protein RodA [Bacteroidales bacterium]
MASRQINIWKSLDWWTLLLYLILVFAGWVSIYAASYNFDDSTIFDFAGRSGKQLMWIGISLSVGFAILMLDNSIFEKFAYFIYFSMIILLIVTIFIAPDVKGSRSWIVMGPISIQPAEFAKFTTALALASLMSSYNFDIFKPSSYIKVASLIALPFLLILIQNETGSALVLSAMVIMLYREGMTPLIIISGFTTIILFVVTMVFDNTLLGSTEMGEFLVYNIIQIIQIGVLMWYCNNKEAALHIFTIMIAAIVIPYLITLFGIEINLKWWALASLIISSLYTLYLSLQTRRANYLFITILSVSLFIFSSSVSYVFEEVLQPHQQGRILELLGLKDDPKGTGYNVRQSKIAIGSGGLTGKGFLNGTQTKLKYVPEQDTDFIFCTVGEEHGFIGSSAVIILFTILIIRILYRSEQQKSSFIRIYGYCVASILLFHLCINVGMVLGVLPVIGIPLPFFSYGGSSLLAFSILLFIYMRLDLVRLEKF